ncbi:unnamed protein product [Alopecurus aequalis]
MAGSGVESSEGSGVPRPVPGSYGRFPHISALRDRLDFYYFQGQDKYYESRAEKYGSTVIRINMPPGLFMAPDARVVALLDSKSFPVLFDTTKVEKKNIFGTYSPSLSLSGGHRTCANLDPSEPTHAKVKKLLFTILASRKDVVIPAFHSHFSSLLAFLESQLVLGGKSNFNTLNDATSFEFICDVYFGVLPSASGLGTTGPNKAAKWLMALLHPVATLGLPMILEDLLLHTVHLPPFLVSGDYKALYKYFSAAAAASEALDAADRIGLPRDEACHNLVYATLLNSYGGLKVLLPGILARVADAGEKFHKMLAAEIRAGVADAGGKVTMAALEKMELTKSTVWEVLRMDPPVKDQFGRAKADLNIESHDGVVFAVKKGELLFGYQPMATRDPRVFGSTAKEFVGDRFVGEEGRKLLPYLYWSNGRETENPSVDNKQCPGKNLILLVGRLLLVEVFLRYDTFSANISKGMFGTAEIEFTGVTKATSGPGTA